MISVKALVILAALFSTNAPASVGALNSSLTDFASHSYLNGSLKLSSSQRKELDCLTKVIWFEARGESKHGKILVANIVQNRMNFGKPFATTVCGVVYQRSQFSWTLESKKKHARFKDVAKKHWKTEQKQIEDTISVAMNVILFDAKPITEATHFCTATERCSFKNVTKLGRYGNHKLYKYKGNS